MIDKWNEKNGSSQSNVAKIESLNVFTCIKQ